MATFGFKTLGWILFGGIAAPGLYLVTSQVAAERARVESVERAIVKARADIRQLETEFDTRANMAQLERWNGDVLALAAPRAEQFVGGEAQLAALNTRIVGSTATQVAYVVPTAPMAFVPPVPVETAPAPAAPAVVAQPARSAPAAAPTPRRADPATGPVRSARVERKAQAVAMLDRTLLSDTTLDDLVRGARAEAVSRR